MAKNTMSYQVDHRHILTVSALMHICPKGLVLSSIGLPASSVSVSPIFFSLFFSGGAAQTLGWAGWRVGPRKAGNPRIPPGARDFLIVGGQTPRRSGVLKNLRSEIRLKKGSL